MRSSHKGTSAALSLFLLLSPASVFAEGTLVDLSTGGKATANSVLQADGYTDYKPEYAFDDIVSGTYNIWKSKRENTSWLQYEFPAPKRINAYTLMWPVMVSQWTTAHMPNTWRFEAWDEESGVWVILDTQKDVTKWTAGLKVKYQTTNTRFFKKYRIYITLSNYYTYDRYNPYNAIGEMELLGDPLDSPLQLDIDTTRATVLGGQLFDTYVVSRNATSLASEEATVAYDANLYEFVSATAETGFQIASQITSTPGQLHFNLTSPGATFNTTGETKLLKLTFRAKEQAGAGKIETTAGSGTFTSGTQIVASLGSETITVNVKTADVNLDGSVTTADLAMAAYAHGGAPLAGYARTDVNNDGAVDDADLNLITQALEATPFPNGGTGYTLDLTQSGDVSASSSHPKTQFYLPYYAFDGDVTSNFYWNAGAYVNKGWLMYDFKVPQRIGKYSLMWQALVGYESYMPKSWTFEAYDEAQAKWLVLDTQRDITTWQTGFRQYFDFPNSNAYKQYRININATNHSTYVGVGEMEMYGKLDAHPELGIETATDTVAAGAAFDTYLAVQNGNALHAEDAKITYDNTLFELVSATPLAPGTQILRQDSATPGQLRLTLANTGVSNAVSAGQLVKLTFKAKDGATGSGRIEAQSGTTATATGAEAAPLTTGTSITIND